MISKELASVVLGGNVKTIHVGDYNVHYDIDYCTSIDIHRLAYMCKEWAYNQGYLLTSYKHDGEWFAQAGFTETLDEEYDESCLAKTEPEAIFQAAQWILDNV